MPPSWRACSRNSRVRKVFDTAAPLCDASRCHVMLDGKLMYRDTHHLSYDGDLYVASSYARQLGLAP
jgi:hypothetical protein